MKKLISRGLIFLISAGILTGCILIPNTVLKNKYNSIANNYTTVPEEYYKGSSDLMAERASNMLSTSDRLKMFTGLWDSHYEKIAPDSRSLSESGAANMAKSEIEDLYRLNLYPYSLLSEYDNWYSWEAELYRYSETSFNTYSCDLWVITFTKYDNSLSHTIYMTEDGIILEASCSENDVHVTNLHSGTNQDSIRSIFNATTVKLIVNEPTDTADYISLIPKLTENYPNYPHKDFISPICETASVAFLNKISEDYIIYQYRTQDSYVLGMIPAALTKDNKEE